MPETPDGMLYRLKAMIAPGQATWDLSENDTAAIRWMLGEVERLRDEALRYYRPDGTFEVLDSPEAVVARRVEAARELERLGAEVERVREAIASALGHVDYLREMWGDEAITKRVADTLRAALEPPAPDGGGDS